MIHAIIRAVWPAPEPALVHAGREGELVVARARVVLLVLVLAGPMASLLRLRTEGPAWVALFLSLSFLAFTGALVASARLREERSWLGFATSVADVTFVTAFHALVFASGFAAMALTSRAMFALYVLAIAATSLRYDGRIATVAGAAAAGQWLALMAWATASGSGAAAIAEGRFVGDVSPLEQTEELVMILAATALAQIIIRRSGELRLSSIRDGLTRLLNRSYFDERLATELARAARYQHPITVAVLDLDTFKQINDTYGHAAGDRALRAIADRLRAAVRSTDLVARYGGDEFALLFPETDAAAAGLRLEAIRQAIAARPIRVRDGVEVTVTPSAGIAVAPADGLEAAALMAAADMRLLAAKRAGRNRLVARPS